MLGNRLSASYLPSTSPITVETVQGTPPPGNITTVILVAMENQSYVDVLGDGHGNGNAPFCASLLPMGATVPLYNNNVYYPGSSEGSYVAMVSGDTYGSVDGTRNIGDASTVTLA